MSFFEDISKHEQSIKRYCYRNYGSPIEIPMNRKNEQQGIDESTLSQTGIDETTLSPFSSDHQ